MYMDELTTKLYFLASYFKYGSHLTKTYLLLHSYQMWINGTKTIIIKHFVFVDENIFCVEIMRGWCGIYVNYKTTFSACHIMNRFLIMYHRTRRCFIANLRHHDTNITQIWLKYISILVTVSYIYMKR